MTASVFTDDVEKCLAAGMNGHVGKPFAPGEVLDMLKMHIHV
jgi:CheY-like chemotaxis protein